MWLLKQTISFTPPVASHNPSPRLKQFLAGRSGYFPVKPVSDFSYFVLPLCQPWPIETF